jgi:hypothetical protein
MKVVKHLAMIGTFADQHQTDQAVLISLQNKLGPARPPSSSYHAAGQCDA